MNKHGSGREGNRVFILLTLGTPHHGTPVSIPDWGLHTLDQRYWFNTVTVANVYYNTADSTSVGIPGLGSVPVPTGFNVSRQGDVDLGWDNFDGPDFGIEYINQFSLGIPIIATLALPNPHTLSLLDANTLQTSLPAGQTDTDLHGSRPTGSLDELNASEQYFQKIVAYGGYDTDISTGNSNFIEFVTAEVLDLANKEHIALSYLATILAEFPSKNEVVPLFYPNDGVVPLQSALFLDKDSSNEPVYVTQQHGFFVLKVGPSLPLKIKDLTSRQVVRKIRAFPDLDHVDLRDSLFDVIRADIDEEAALVDHAAIAVTPSSFDFGAVAVGSSSQATFSTSNIGYQTLTIANVSISSGEFVLQAPVTPFDIPPGGSDTFQVSFAPSVVGIQQATITIDSNAPTSPTLVTVSGTGASPPPPSPPDLTITKSDSPDPVTSGGTLTYTITVQNIGSGDAASADVSDILPTGSTFQSCSVPCSVSGNSVTVTLGPLSAGATTSFNILVTAPTVSVLTDIINVAVVSTTTPEPDTSNNQASLTTTVNPVEVTVSVSPQTVTLAPGDSQQFTATVTGTTNTTVIWSVLEGTAGGTITTDGFYAAPLAKGMFHVLATSQSDSTKSAMATVTVVQAPNSFVPTGSMGTPRREHTATLLPDGKVLIAGGDNSSAFLATAELYDPVTGIFTPTGGMTTERSRHTATLLPDGKVLFAGGLNSSGFLARAELYNPLTGTFTPMGSMATQRELHTATLLPNGKVLLAGGDGDSGALNSAELYDPVAGSFAVTGSMAFARLFHTATLLLNGEVLITGGFRVVGGSGVTEASTELYDPTAGTFTPASSISTARELHSATLLSNGTVLVAGGVEIVAGFFSYKVSAEVYDPVKGNFASVDSMATPRAAHTTTLLQDGKVLIAGGDTSCGLGCAVAIANAEIYDATTSMFTSTDSMTTARDFHTATLLPNGNVLVAGPDSSAEIYIFAITP